MWLFKKMLKKFSEKKTFFFFFFYWCSSTLCIQTIMNTNKVHVSASLLFITYDHDAPRVPLQCLLISNVYRAFF